MVEFIEVIVANAGQLSVLAVSIGLCFILVALAVLTVLAVVVFCDFH